jgi:hypothetical protein
VTRKRGAKANPSQTQMLSFAPKAQRTLSVFICVHLWFQQPLRLRVAVAES